MTGSGLHFLWGGIEKEATKLGSGSAEVEQKPDGPVFPVHEALKPLLLLAGDPALHEDADGNALRHQQVDEGMVRQADSLHASLGQHVHEGDGEMLGAAAEALVAGEEEMEVEGQGFVGGHV